MTFEVPICFCVKGARKLSSVFMISSKYRTEGTAASAGVGYAIGYFVVRCDYCGTMLKAVEAHDFTKPVELYESQGGRSGV